MSTPLGISYLSLFAECIAEVERRSWLEGRRGWSNRRRGRLPTRGRL